MEVIRPMKVSKEIAEQYSKWNAENPEAMQDICSKSFSEGIKYCMEICKNDIEAYDEGVKNGRIAGCVTVLGVTGLAVIGTYVVVKLLRKQSKKSKEKGL